MMGKASEGAWLELGISLINKVPPEELKSVGKQRATLEDSQAGTMKKIQAVLTLYDRSDIFNTLAASSGIRRQELAFASDWSDLVRDSRNTIHFGVSPATPNTYEKVAALLLGVAPHMRVLYTVKTAADAI
jgi:hypothetical protein